MTQSNTNFLQSQFRFIRDCLDGEDAIKAGGQTVQHTRMQIVGGENETETKERGVTFNNVSKNLLLGTMNSALHTGELQLGDFPMRDTLQTELESFEASIGSSGRMSISGGTKEAHADIAMAAAMAIWLSDHRTVGAHVGTSELRGYW
jgi:hypothetical protein